LCCSVYLSGSVGYIFSRDLLFALMFFVQTQSAREKK